MKRVIIADLKSTNHGGTYPGHYLAVAKNYRAVFKNICELHIASGPICQDKFDRSEMIMLPCDSMAGESKVKNICRMIKNGWSLFRQTKPDDVIIIQQSQPAMILLTLILTCFRKNGVYQIQYSDEPMRRFYYRLFFRLKRRYIKGTICPNEIVGKAYGVPYLVIPDYIYCGESKRVESDYVAKNYDFCSVGSIAKDKGVADTARIMSLKPYSMIIAGYALDKEEAKKINGYADQSNCIDTNLNFLSEQQFNDYLNGSRYTILNYTGSYAERSSGIVLDTLFKGVPVIGRRCKALDFVEKENLGILYDNLEDIDFEALLNKDRHQEFVDSINKYLLSYEKHKKNLRGFLGV